MTAPVAEWSGRVSSSPTVRAPRAARSVAGLWALLPAAVAFAVGFYQLDARDMWNDELVTWHVTTLSAAEFRMLIGNIDLVHAAYYLVITAVTTVFGDSELALRLPSVVAVALTAALVTLIGRRLVDLPVGVVAGLAFALLPTVSRYAQEARSYALVTLAAVAATWLFLRAVEHPYRWRWWAYGITVVLVGWLHFVALLVVLAHLVYLWRAVPGETARWRWALTSGVAGLFVLPLLILASRQSGQISWVRNDWAAVQRFGQGLTGNYAILGVAVVLGLLGLALARQERRPAALMLLVWAALPLAVGYLTSTWLHLFLARYFLFTLPAWALLMAFGLGELLRAVSRGRLPALRVLGLLLLLPALGWLGLPEQERVRSNEADGQPYYLDAVRYVGEQARTGDGVAYNDGFGGPSDIARKATDFGLRDGDRPRDVFLATPTAATGWLTARECVDPGPCVRDTTRIWLIETGHAGDSLAGLPAARAAFLKEKFVVRHVESFERVRVVLLERPTD